MLVKYQLNKWSTTLNFNIFCIGLNNKVFLVNLNWTFRSARKISTAKMFARIRIILNVIFSVRIFISQLTRQIFLGTPCLPKAYRYFLAFGNPESNSFSGVCPYVKTQKADLDASDHVLFAEHLAVNRGARNVPRASVKTLNSEDVPLYRQQLLKRLQGLKTNP